MAKLKILDLFSGIGGFSLGLENTGGFETVAFCEIDPFCKKVLNKHWPSVPIHNDVRNLEHEGSIDVICGGFPCQPFSVAGKQKGKEDDRHLWPAMFGLIKKHRPSWVIGENVAGFINMALDDVLANLESENYECRAFVIPACAVNAPHRRDRVWILGHSKHDGSLATTERSKFNAPGGNDKKRQEQAVESEGTGGPENHEALANTAEQRQQGQGELKQSLRPAPPREGQAVNVVSGGIRDQWAVEPCVGRVAHGIPRRMDRLKSLGNAVVPQIPEAIGRAILETYILTKARHSQK